MFDPYFTTKKQGSGLGLATSYSIVKRHEGHMDVESRLGHGTLFRLYLPASRMAPSNDLRVADIRPGHGRILAMDDDADILSLVAEMLGKLGYEAETVSDGAAAVERYRRAREEGRPFAGVILDLTVPGGQGGLETIRQLIEMDATVKAIVSSGYSEDPVMARYRDHGFSGVVAKPYSLEGLSRALHDLLSPHAE